MTDMLTTPHLTLVASPTLEDMVRAWWLDLRVARRTANTLRSYQQPWELFLKRTGIVMLDQFTASCLKGYLLDLEQIYRNRPATIHKAYRTLRAFTSWAVREEYPVDPSLLFTQRLGRRWFRVLPPTVPQEEMPVFSADELRALETLTRHRLLMHVLLGTGVRLNEALRLTVDDLHVSAASQALEDQIRALEATAHVFEKAITDQICALENEGQSLDATGREIERATYGEKRRLAIDHLRMAQEAHKEHTRSLVDKKMRAIHEAGNAAAFLSVAPGKSHLARTVPLTAHLTRELQNYLREQRPACVSRHLFVTAEGQPVRDAPIQKYFGRATRRLGFRVHAHKFRHTFATGFLRRWPGEMETLRRLLGHADYSMIKRYVRLNTEDLARDWEAKAPF